MLLFFILANTFNAVFTYVFDKYLSPDPSGGLWIILFMVFSAIILNIGFAAAFIISLLEKRAAPYVITAFVVISAVILSLAVHYVYSYLGFIHLMSLGLSWCMVYYKIKMSKNGG